MNAGARSYSRRAATGRETASIGAERPACDAFVHVLDADEWFRNAAAQQLRNRGLAVLCYASADQFMATYAPQEYECLLVDLALPGMPAYELQSLLRNRHILSPVIVVSDSARTADIVVAVQRGAADFLEKPIPEHLLVEKVEAALEKDRSTKLRRGNVERRLARLTDREREVMELLVAAKTTVEAAHRLGISPKTIEKHRVRVFDKLNVASVPALIRLVCNLADEK